MSSLILIVVALILLFVVWKIAKEFFKIVSLIIIFFAIIWLLHPVCQTNTLGETFWHLRPTSYLSNFFQETNPVQIKNSQTFCKIWTTGQSFFQFDKLYRGSKIMQMSSLTRQHLAQATKGVGCLWQIPHSEPTYGQTCRVTSLSDVGFLAQAAFGRVLTAHTLPSGFFIFQIIPYSSDRWDMV